MSEAQIFQANDGINAIFIHSSVDDAGLDPFEFRVLMHLSRRANRKGMAWPGVATIAETTRMSERKVRDALRALEERKMLVTSQAPGKGNRHQYELTAASEWILEPAPRAALEPETGTTGSFEPAPRAVSSTREVNPVEGYPDKGHSPVVLGNSKKFLAHHAGAAILEELPEPFTKHANFCLRLGEFVAERFKMGRKMTPEACHRLALKFAKHDPDTCTTALETTLDRGWTGVFPESVKPSQTGAITAQPELSQWGFGE